MEVELNRDSNPIFDNWDVVIDTYLQEDPEQFFTEIYSKNDKQDQNINKYLNRVSILSQSEVIRKYE